jgi:hypothetical protein
LGYGGGGGECRDRRSRARWCTTQPSGPSAGTVSFGAALSGLASWSRPSSTWARRCSPRRAAVFVAEPIAPATTVPPLRGLSARTAPGRSARRACAGRRRRDLTDGRRGASRTNEAFAAASGGRRSPAPSAANTRRLAPPQRALHGETGHAGHRRRRPRSDVRRAKLSGAVGRCPAHVRCRCTDCTRVCRCRCRTGG